MKNFYKKLIVGFSIILVSICLVGAYFLFLAPKTQEGEKDVSVKITYAENSFSYDVKTDSTTVLELLKEMDKEYELLLETESSAYGEFITSLKGVKQDEEKGYYYVYTIKGLDFASGVSTQTIKDGDVIEFKYLQTVYDENWNEISSELKGKGKIASYEITKIVLILISSILCLSGISYLVVSLINRKKNEKK